MTNRLSIPQCRKCTLTAGTFLMLIGAFPEIADGQSLAWAARSGGLSLDEGRRTAVDSSGNSYYSGVFTGSATFGPGDSAETVLMSASGSQDTYMAKYNGSGALVWAKRGGGDDVDQAWGIALDAGGNSYATGNLGRFTSVADFGDGVTLNVNGNGNWSFVFVVKRDSNGTAIWATNLGLGGTGIGITLDGAGNIYVAGSAPDPVLGGGIITIWKLGPAGNILWVKQATGNYSGTGMGISATTVGDLFVTGTFQSGSATFGAGESAETTLTAGGAGLLFVARYGSNGALVWAKQSQSNDGILARGLSLDSSSNVHIVGYGSGTLGAGEPTQTNVSGAFIGKFGAGGGLIWAKSISGNGSAVIGEAVANDPSGNSYLIGGFTTTVTFAPGEANATTLTSLGGFLGGDIYVAKYSPAGAFLWARQAGGNATTGGVDFGGGIAVDTTGNAYTTGYFSGMSTFGPGETRQTVLASSNGSDWDVFVAKYMNDSNMTPQLDLDIADLRTTNRVSISHGGTVNITLVVKNAGTVAGFADATVVGTQGGSEVYRRILSVTDAVGNGRTSFTFPTYAPVAAGDITWTATIADQNPDIDMATTVTRVVP